MPPIEQAYWELWGHDKSTIVVAGGGPEAVEAGMQAAVQLGLQRGSEFLISERPTRTILAMLSL